MFCVDLILVSIAAFFLLSGSFSSCISATAVGKDVTTRIIPLLLHLRQEIPLLLGTMFSVSLLQEFKLKKKIECWDLVGAAYFFDLIAKK